MKYQLPLLAALVLIPSLASAQDAAAKSKELIAVLNSQAPTFDKARACQELAHLGQKEAVPALAALLGDEKLAAYARCGLESIADPSAGEALRAAVGKLQGKCLAGVVTSLGVRGDTQDVAALKRLAADRASGVSAAAFMALGRIASPEAAAFLTQSLASDSAEARQVAADACLLCAQRLVAAGKPADGVALDEAVRKADVPRQLRNAATQGTIVAGQDRGIALFVEQLKSADDAAFSVAMRAARRAPAEGIGKALLAEVDRLPAPRKALVIIALGDRHEKAALSAIQKAMADSQSDVRLAAIHALGQLGDPSSVPLLLDALASPDPKLAEAARDCLRTVQGEGVDEAICARLDQGSAKARIAVLETIAQRGVGSSAPAVLKLCEDPTPEIRDAAVRALGPMVELKGVTMVTRQLLAAKTPAEMAAVEESLAGACGRISDKDGCARILAASIAQASPAAKVALVELLGKTGGSQGLKIVAGYAKGNSVELRDAALRAVGKWPGLDAAPVLLDLAKTLADKQLATGALRGYIRLARQMDMKPEERIAMCETALAAAARAEEQVLVLKILPRIPSAKTLGIAVAHLGRPGLKDDAATVALAIAEKLAASEPSAVAEPMQKLLAAGVSDAQVARAKAVLAKSASKKGMLFDGKTFDGWEGDTKKSFRIEEGAIVGGTLKARIPRNEFLCTTRSYKNFILRAECRLIGPANGGIQIRSQRIPNNNEVSGSQADMSAEPNGGYWGSLYDESRRNRMLAMPERALLMKTLKPNDWNLYEIRCEGPHIRLYLNGVQTVDYVEKDPKIPLSGIIGLQIHAGGPSEAWYRNITIEELP